LLPVDPTATLLLVVVVAAPDVDVEDAVVVDVVDVVVVVDVVDVVDEDTFVTPPLMQAGPECVFLYPEVFLPWGPCIFPVFKAFNQMASISFFPDFFVVTFCNFD
jgi:hypothetical protein